MSTQSFDHLEINSPVESSATNSIASGGYLVSPVGNGTGGDCAKNKQVQVSDSTDIGWLKFRPMFLNRFMNARWMLFWLCWGSTLQGKRVYFLFIEIQIFYFFNFQLTSSTPKNVWVYI